MGSVESIEVRGIISATDLTIQAADNLKYLKLAKVSNYISLQSHLPDGVILEKLQFSIGEDDTKMDIAHVLYAYYG